MTDIAKQAVAASVHFEAKKHAYRQTQDGVVISFVMHPGDVAATLATAPLGTRYVVALVEVSDDETPVSPEAQEQRTKTAKDRRPWSSLPLSQQASIRCAEPAFWRYLYQCPDGSKSVIQSADEAAEVVREMCRIRSRKQLDASGEPADIWRRIDGDFQFWLKHPEAA